MSVTGVPIAPPQTPFLAARLALREMRGGLRGFYVFIACIALGVMAIAGVGSVAGSLADGLARQGRVILGGDLSFSLMHREVDDAERAFLTRRGDLSVATTMRAMARTMPGAADSKTSLVEIKAVDRAYPLTGVVVLDPPLPLPDVFAARDNVFGAAADPALLTRLDLKIGDRITVGTGTIEIRASLTSEPDKLAGGIGFGPRLLMSEAGLRATGLLQPGSLVRWIYRLRLPQNASSDAATTALVKDARAQLPEAGWDIRTRTNASPQLERNVDRFTQFLTIVGPDRPAGRRRRCRQRRQQPSRPQARVDCDHEGAGRDRRARLLDLSDSGDRAGDHRRADRRSTWRGAALRGVLGFWQNHSAADRTRGAAKRTRARLVVRPCRCAGVCTLAARPRP